MKYGSIEYQYARPIANALASDETFRNWVLSKTKFASMLGARLLHEEMASWRRNSAAEWWRFHFTEKCRCEGCSGKETDILAIFESETKIRFALHFEVKQPKDKFPKNEIQSKGYPLRAQCWAKSAPAKVLPHNLASTVLLFSERKRTEYMPHLPHFETLITFEEMERSFHYLFAAPGTALS